MDRQTEIEIPEQPKNPTLYCTCLKGERVVVVLQKSVSSDYLFGKCNYCGKVHTRKVRDGQDSEG